MKIAQFESMSTPGSFQFWDEGMEKYTTAGRISEYVDVQFPPRALEELVPAQVAIIDRKIAEVSAELGRQIAELKDAKGRLLALTDQREVIA